MTINYYGQMKDCKFNTRVMEVSYRDNEEILVLRTADLIEKTTPYRCSRFDNLIMFVVDDREAFESLKVLFREYRAMFRNCMKYGF